MVDTYTVGSKELVSILIPVYNREGLVAECICSALGQTYSQFEVVIVDNASTDNTWSICQDFAARDPRVRIFRNDSNLGPVRNWRRCLEEARGTYGKILFSDDLMAPGFLEQAVTWLQDEEVGFVFSSIEIGERPGTGDVPYRWRRTSGRWPSMTFIRESLLGGKVPVSPGAALFRLADLRKNLLLEIPTAEVIDFTRYGAGPDVLLYLMTAATYPMIAYLSDPLTFFRSHADSITVRENNSMISSHYFQAKLWFASQISSERPSLAGTLRQQCLAYGWLMQCRHDRTESFAEFCRRQGEPKAAGSWLTFVFVHLYRMKMRHQRSFLRFLDRLLGARCGN